METRKKIWPLEPTVVSNLIVVLIGIAFYLGLSNFAIIRIKLNQFLHVLSPFIVGFMIAYLLNTPTKFLHKRVFSRFRHGRLFSIVGTYLLAVMVMIILLNLIWPQVWSSAMELINKMPAYVKGLNSLGQDLIDRFHLEGEGINQLLGSYQDFLKNLNKMASDSLPQILDIGMAVGNGLVTALTAFIASIYMLSDKNRLVRQLKKLTYAVLPVEKAAWILRVCSQANDIFVGFINGKLIDSAIIGLLCFILNLILGIPYNILIAVVIGVTNIIPFFGPIIGAVPCVMILLIVDPWAALRFGILVIALQQFDGNILGPKILGDSTGLSAIWVLVAIIVGGGLFGFAGMLLGVPTFAVLYALVREWTNHRLSQKGIDGNGNPLTATSEGEL